MNISHHVHVRYPRKGLTPLVSLRTVRENDRDSSLTSGLVPPSPPPPPPPPFILLHHQKRQTTVCDSPKKR